MRALPFLLLLAACSGPEPGAKVYQLDASEDGNVSIEERHKPAREVMNDTSKGVRDRYEEAIEWCLGEFAIASYCTTEIVDIARAAMATEMLRHRKTAETVTEFEVDNQADECAGEKIRNLTASRSRICDLEPFIERLEQSQASWRAFAGLQCNLEASNSIGGSGEYTNLDSCMTRLIGARIEELQRMMRFYEAQYLSIQDTTH